MPEQLAKFLTSVQILCSCLTVLHGYPQHGLESPQALCPMQPPRLDGWGMGPIAQCLLVACYRADGLSCNQTVLALPFSDRVCGSSQKMLLAGCLSGCFLLKEVVHKWQYYPYSTTLHAEPKVASLLSRTWPVASQVLPTNWGCRLCRALACKACGAAMHLRIIEINLWLLCCQLGCAKLHLGASLCLLLRKDTQWLLEGWYHHWMCYITL